MEHFSRYGLLDDDDEEEDEAQADVGRPGASSGSGALVVAARKLPPGVRSFGLFGAQDDDQGGLLV